MVANTFPGVWLQMVLPQVIVWFLAELEMLATLLIDGKALHTTVTHCTLSQARDALDILHKYVGLSVNSEAASA